MKEISQVELGKRIRSAREKLNMSQYRLHEKTKISTTQISAYENGKKNIGLHSLAKIAAALNITMDELYYGQPSLKPINTASNDGELIVNCIHALYEKEVVRALPHEKQNDFVFEQVSLTYRIGFRMFVPILDDLVLKLEDFEKEKGSYPDPEGFKNQLLASAANQINAIPVKRH